MVPISDFLTGLCRIPLPAEGSLGNSEQQFRIFPLNGEMLPPKSKQGLLQPA